VESSCEFGIEPCGSIKCWETMEDLSSSAQRHTVKVGCSHPVAYTRSGSGFPSNATLF
jgi:hypothetical protein